MTGNLLTLDQVAERISVSRRTVERYIVWRELAAIRIGRAVRVAEADLASFLERRRQPAVKLWTGRQVA